MTQLNTDLLREARGARSRDAVAHELRKRGHNSDAKAIWRWETGKNLPSSAILPDLCSVLGISVTDLFSEVAK